MRIPSSLSALSIGLVVCGCAGATQQSSSGATVAAITPADLEHRLRIIADDSTMGRASGSEGDYKTADYIASEFKRLGLEPAGENGTYFQTVPFWVRAADPASQLDVGGSVLHVGRDFLPGTLAAGYRTVGNVEIVYGGSLGDTSTIIGPDQAADRIVILTPREASLRGLRIPGGRFSRAKAIGVVMLDNLAPEFQARYRDGRSVPDSSSNPSLLPLLWLSKAAATTLLGADPNTLAPGTAGRRVSGGFGFRTTPVPYPARNVVAILRGSDPALRGEYVSLTAHNDHVGFDRTPADHDSLRAFNRVIRPMGADSPQREPTAEEWTRIHSILDSLRRVHPPRLDSIRNGADDDGSGTVSVLNIAQAFATGATRPKRSILFIWHAGEEKGLWGSEYFTDHPTVPINSVITELNIDMIGRFQNPGDENHPVNKELPKPNEIFTIGNSMMSTELGQIADQVNNSFLKLNYNPKYADPNDPNRYFYRSDHFNYARKGVPIIFFMDGTHADYHQPSDSIEKINFDEMAKVAKTIMATGWVLANGAKRPTVDKPLPASVTGN